MAANVDSTSPKASTESAIRHEKLDSAGLQANLPRSAPIIVPTLSILNSPVALCHRGVPAFPVHLAICTLGEYSSRDDRSNTPAVYLP